MRVVESGHIYQLDYLDTEGYEGPVPNLKVEHGLLVFVNREDNPHPGTQTQEVIRALIDRTQHCDSCLRWNGNDKIIYHLRMALALHESRAIERKAEKGLIEPENLAVGPDGHYILGKKEDS